MAGGELGDLIEAQLIVPPHHWRLTQLADVAGEIVDEGVVVVDEKNHEESESLWSLVIGL
jgi:hypothetical protein